MKTRNNFDDESATQWLAKRLREARTIAGYSQKQAAEKIGVAKNTIIGIERAYRQIDAIILMRLIILYESSYILMEFKERVKQSRDNWGNGQSKRQYTGQPAHRKDTVSRQ